MDIHDRLIINPFKRYQNGLYIELIFPKPNDGTCSCGCKTKLTGRKTRWHSRQCMLKASTYFLVLKGDNYTIRDTVFGRDNGVCNECGEVDRNWQADHILPVHKGGGGCTIDNFQTLCVGCHKRKTVRQIQL